MNSEIEQSPREIAERIANTNPYTGYYCNERKHDLIDAINKALADRDERGARILETAAMLASPVGVIPESDPEHERLARMSEVLLKAASAIRGKSK
jgi:hypothetical protein